MALFRASKGKSNILPGGFGQGFRVSGEYTTEKFLVTDPAESAVRCLVSTELEQNQVDASLYWDAPTVKDLTWDSEFAKTRQWGVAPEGKVLVRVEMRFSTTDQNEASFGPWLERAQQMEATVKWAQARIHVKIVDPAFTVEIMRFRLNFDVPDVSDSGSGTTSAGGTVQVDFNKVYTNVPFISVTVLGGSDGDESPRVLNKDKFGFDVEVKNTGVRVVRNFDWTAVGY